MILIMTLNYNNNKQTFVVHLFPEIYVWTYIDQDHWYNAVSLGDNELSPVYAILQILMEEASLVSG